jgi:hypothetical protein
MERNDTLPRSTPVWKREGRDASLTQAGQEKTEHDNMLTLSSLELRKFVATFVDAKFAEWEERQNAAWAPLLWDRPGLDSTHMAVEVIKVFMR